MPHPASHPAASGVAPWPTEPTDNLGFESTLWQAADLLRNNMDPAEYKHVVLGLLFLKYIEDAFSERRAALAAAVAAPDSDEYTAENVFWVPITARWTHIQAQATQPTIGKTLDDGLMWTAPSSARISRSVLFV